MKVCHSCGAPLEDGVKFCTECGARMEIPEQPAPPVCPPPPEPVREMPVQTVYQPQETEKSSDEPKAHTPRKKKKGRLFVIIAIFLLLVIVLRGCKTQGEKADWGRYDAVSAEADGGSVAADGEWIELKKNGRAKLYFMDSEFSARWTLNGTQFTLKQNGDLYTGSLENGVLTMDLAGISYTFAKEGAAPVTYKAVACISGGQILDEELMDLIGGCYIRFNGDHTGTFYCFGDPISLTYDDKSMKIDGESIPYTIKNNTMEFTYVDGTGFTLEPTQEDPDAVIASEFDWDTGEWEAEQMGLPAELDWIGQPITGLNLDGASINFNRGDVTGTARLKQDADGNLLVERLHLFLYEVDFLSVRDLLVEQFGDPTGEGEEPYAAGNNGAITYCWFEHPAGSLKLASASETEYLEIIIDTK